MSKGKKPSIWRWFNTSKPGVSELDEAAQELVDNARAFDRLRIEDLMVPRADIKAVELETGLAELAQAFIDAGHSRLPVYRGNLDDPVGMVHIKDLVPSLLELGNQRDSEGGLDLASLTREVLFVPPSMNADDLLVRMQKTRVHMALVVDEYGGTDGLVTLEDLIEQIVGNIEDEHDAEMKLLQKTGPDSWEANARLDIDQLEEAVGVVFQNADEDDEVDTLGGLIFTMAGRVPSVGEILRHSAGYEFEILRADPRRILSVCIRKNQPSDLKSAD